MDTNIREVPPLFEAVEVTVEDVQKAAARKLYAQLEPMALIGMGGKMISALVALGAEVGGLGRIAGYRLKHLAGPIICHSRTHELQSHPLTNNAVYKHHIVADRLKWVLGLTEMPVGPTELVMIMYEASLEAPMHHELAELYIWAGKTAMYRVNPKNLETLNHVSSKFSADGDPEQILADPMMRHTYFGFVNEIMRKVGRNASD